METTVLRTGLTPGGLPVGLATAGANINDFKLLLQRDAYEKRAVAS